MYNNTPTAVDFAVTCPYQNRYNNSDDPANTYATEQKHKKYDSGFVGTEVQFCAAVVDTFGQWSDEGLDLISDVVNRAAKRLIAEPNHFRNVACNNYHAPYRSTTQEWPYQGSQPQQQTLHETTMSPFPKALT